MKILQRIVTGVLRCYQLFVSPAKSFVFGPLARCRFEPSCSSYTIRALEIHGILDGSKLALNRVCRCHPWGGCGLDPVPRPTPSTRRPHPDPVPQRHPQPVH